MALEGPIPNITKANSPPARVLICTPEGAEDREAPPWTPEAWERMMDRCRSVSGALGSGGGVDRILLEVSPGTPLSDAPSCLTFLRQCPAGFGVMLDPLAMLAPSMHMDAGEHLERIAVSLIDSGLAGLVRLPESERGLAARAEAAGVPVAVRAAKVPEPGSPASSEESR